MKFEKITVKVFKAVGATSETFIDFPVPVQPFDGPEGSYLMANLHLTALTLSFPEPATLRVRAYIDDYECKAGTFRVAFRSEAPTVAATSPD